MLKITNLTFPCFAANCYLVTDESTNESLLIDPGSYGDRQRDYIKSQGIDNLKYILLTHGHYDHILGVAKFKEAVGGDVVIHENDQEKLSSKAKSLFLLGGIGRKFTPVDADIKVRDGDSLPFGDYKIEVIHTPGHSKGSVCYKIGDCLFTGDTLFRGTVGRTDFPDSDQQEMLSSLKALYAIEGDYKVYPGHEGTSTLSYEKQTNPYMKLCR